MSWDPAEEPAEPDELRMLALMFDNHAEHLYEYCKQLVGDPDQAASVTEAAFIAARSVLENPENLRAWLFALARTEALSKGQERAPGDSVRSDAGDDDDQVNTDGFSVAEIAAQAERYQEAATAPVPELTDRQREVLDLVYRHGIRPDHLPAILGLPPEEALALLADAEEGFAQAIQVGSSSEADDGEADLSVDGPHLLAGESPADVPEPIGLDAFDAAAHAPIWAAQSADDSAGGRHRAGDQGGEPGPMIRSRRLRLGVAAALPVAALAGVGLYLVSSSPQHPHGGGSKPAAHASSGVAAPASLAGSLPPHHTKGHSKSIASLFPTDPQSGYRPVPSPTTSRKPKPHRSTIRPSPSPSSSHPSPTPDPSATSPTPTGTPSSPASPSAAPTAS